MKPAVGSAICHYLTAFVEVLEKFRYISSDYERVLFLLDAKRSLSDPKPV